MEKQCRKCGQTKDVSEFYTYERRCKVCRKADDRAYWREHRSRRIEAQRNRRKTARERVLAHYGARCVCCGEETIEFLSVDHINGDGADHRRSDSTVKDICLWLIKNDFPEGFRILCHNCNASLGRYGYCPHGVPASRPATTIR